MSRSVYDNVAISIMLALAVFRWKHIARSPLLIGLLSTYVAFSLFVKEVGPYAGMIIPFVIATIVVLMDRSTSKQGPNYAVMLLVASPGLLLLGLRGLDLYFNAECRDNDTAAAVITNGIGDARHIVAPFKYYFFIEDPERTVTTLEYSKVAPVDVIKDADAVFADDRQSELL